MTRVIDFGKYLECICNMNQKLNIPLFYCDGNFGDNDVVCFRGNTKENVYSAIINSEGYAPANVEKNPRTVEYYLKTGYPFPNHVLHSKIEGIYCRISDLKDASFDWIVKDFESKDCYLMIHPNNREEGLMIVKDIHRIAIQNEFHIQRKLGFNFLKVHSRLSKKYPEVFDNILDGIDRPIQEIHPYICSEGIVMEYKPY